MNVDWLVSDYGQGIVSEAMDYPDSLVAVSTLRKKHSDVDRELISQAVTQAGLHTTLAKRWGQAVTGLVLTQEGIEQATRPSIAKWRAHWIKERFGAQGRILDMTCGLGFDALAMAQAGLQVAAIERDSITAQCARHNLKKYSIEVIEADATEVSTAGYDLLFIDPMRRDSKASRAIDGSQKRIFNPELWSPSWNSISKLAENNRVLCKVAPGIDDKYLADWDTTWLSSQGDVVEAMILSNGVGMRSAVVIDGTEVWQSSATTKPSIQDAGAFLLVPDGAITRSGAISEICNLVNGGLVNEHIGWVLSDDWALVEKLIKQKPKLVDAFQILNQVKADERTIESAIKDVPSSAITIMTRGVQVDVERVRKRISPKLDSSAPELVIGFYRHDGGNRALICRRIRVNN